MASFDDSSSLADRVQSLRLPPAAGTSGGAALPWFFTVVLGCVLAWVLIVGNPLRPAKDKDNSTAAGNESSPTQKPGASANNTPIPSTTGSRPGGDSQPAPGTVVAESKGYVIPEQQILVSPQVSGRVVELNFEAGQQVEKGFILAVLDNTEYLAEYERVKAQLESAQETLAELREGNRPDEIKQAKADLAEAQANLDQLEKDFIRKKDLFARKIIQLQELEAAESQYTMIVKRVEKLTAMAQLMMDGPRRERKRAAEAQVRQIEAELRRSKWRLDNCVIASPITGTILKKNAELGNLVNPIAFNGSFSLCDIADLSKLEVELSIQERDISKIYKGQLCKVRSEAYPKRIYDGVVSRLLPIADRAKGSIPVRVRLTVPPEEQGVYLKPEMGANVQFYAAATLATADNERPPVETRETSDSSLPSDNPNEPSRNANPGRDEPDPLAPQENSASKSPPTDP